MELTPTECHVPCATCEGLLHTCENLKGQLKKAQAEILRLQAAVAAQKEADVIAGLDTPADLRTEAV